MSNKVLLIIRDGWGYREETEKNYIALADTPNTDALTAKFPHTIIKASGLAVGLPDGFQGNSEVGHMTIGSGRIAFKSLVRINTAIEDGSFFTIPEFLDAIENARKHGTVLHLLGLLQSEGVHAHEDHLFALLDLCKQQNFSNVLVHVITDGRDAPIHDSLLHLAKLQAKFDEIGFGKVATISGRYYTMDRDTRWERTQKAYDAIVLATSLEKFDDAKTQIETCHTFGETDEFIVPRCASWYAGIKKDDSFIFFNCRTDRTRQLTKAMINDNFVGWERDVLPIFFVAMTEFYRPLPGHVAFKDISMENILGEVLANHGKHQLRISETEKYAHITFFFNGQREVPYEFEDRIMIPSPKIASYDLKPEMSVYEIADNLVEQISTEKYEFIATNLVNGDMVGHTAVADAIIHAVEAVDDCVGKIVASALDHGYSVIITADHGNAEDKTPAWETSHTINPVPLILVSNNPELQNITLQEGGTLADIAPTVLELLGIEKPVEMTAKSLIVR